MEDRLMGFKAGMAAACSAVASFLGWQGVMALVWVVVMGLDYLSGSAAACKAGQLRSAAARAGLWHKGGMILVVCVAFLGDCVMAVMCANLPMEMDWCGAILPLVLGWYILTELGSILENAVKMGANVPAWLVKLLKAGLDVVENQTE
jgi:toxin secretion/phage lysis holin